MSEAIENNVERMHEKSFFGRGVYGVCFCVVDDVSAVRAKLGLFWEECIGVCFCIIDGVESVCVMPVSVCLTACGDLCGVCVFGIVGDEWSTARIVDFFERGFDVMCTS